MASDATFTAHVCMGKIQIFFFLVSAFFCVCAVIFLHCSASVKEKLVESGLGSHHRWILSTPEEVGVSLNQIHQTIECNQNNITIKKQSQLKSPFVISWASFLTKDPNNFIKCIISVNENFSNTSACKETLKLLCY